LTEKERFQFKLRAENQLKLATRGCERNFHILNILLRLVNICNPVKSLYDLSTFSFKIQNDILSVFFYFVNKLEDKQQ
jgi:hypothetical protein